MGRMKRIAPIRSLSPIFLTVLVAIGCGSGKPQDAAATAQQSGPAAPAQAAPAAAPSAAAHGSATIRGTIHLSGAAPVPEKIKMDADPVCQQQHATPVVSEEVVAGAGGALQNVFVYVKEGAKGPFAPPSSPVTLSQQGCWYQPHVFGIQTNQPLEIVNNDATLHNINAKPTANQPFNVAQPVMGMKTTKKFAKPEVMVTFKCNVHPWMCAYAGVVSHPFFSVSGADGSFAITGLPAGSYAIEAWQETYGAQSRTVSVADGETKTADFTFQGQ